MRWLRHLFAPSARRLFPATLLDRIAETIASGERSHTGELMFAVESSLSLADAWRGVSARQRAELAFTHLRTWDTRHNKGVLIYLLLADHAIEIVADRGLHGRVTAAQWREVCRRIEQGLHAGHPERAVLDGVAAVSELLTEHFPLADGDSPEDELPNRPQLLG